MEKKTIEEKRDNSDKLYIVSSKNYKEEHKAPDHMTAYAQFFKKILDKKIKISEIGQIVTALEPHQDMKDAKPMRVLPTLVNLDLMDEENGALNLINVIGKIDPKEAHELLETARAQDRHMIERIEKLRMEEWK